MILVLYFHHHHGTWGEVEVELRGHHLLNHPTLVQVTLKEKHHQQEGVEKEEEEGEEEDVFQGLLHTSTLRK